MYDESLRSHGVADYSLEECRREYRAQAIHGLILTVPVSMGVQQTERGDAMFDGMARRAADQLVRNESYAALEG